MMRRMGAVSGGVGSLAVLVLFLLFTPRREPLPTDAAGLARWVSAHPADFVAASALTEKALDLTTPRRFEVWRAAYEHAFHLAPYRPNTRIAYIRSALFHWYELQQSDRKAVLTAAAPIVRQPDTFFHLYRHIWELTNDFAYLRRVNPGTAAALVQLQMLAATNGLFADYRSLRTEVAQKRLEEFRARRATSSPADVLRMAPEHPTKFDEPLLREILQELERRPLDSDPAAPIIADAVIDYSLRHGLKPLAGLEMITRVSNAASDPARARLALALGESRRADEIQLSSSVVSPAAWTDYYRERAALEERRGNHSIAALYRSRAGRPRDAWTGFCGSDLCTRAWREIAAESATAYAVTLSPVQHDEVAPYVELYVDDALAGEGVIDGERTLSQAHLTAGTRRVELRLVNPLTRNLAPRRAKVLRETL